MANRFAAMLFAALVRHRPRRLRPRSVRLLRPPPQPRRLVRHVRPHRLLLSGRQPALLERQLPLDAARIGSRQLSLPLTALPSIAPLARLPRHRPPWQTMSIVVIFLNARKSGASMYSRPSGLERRALRCVARGGPSRASYAFATHPAAVCGRRSSTSRSRGELCKLA